MMMIICCGVVVFDGDDVVVTVDEAAGRRCFCRRWPLMLWCWMDSSNIIIRIHNN